MQPAPTLYGDTNELQESRNETLRRGLDARFPAVIPISLPVDFMFYVGEEKKYIERKVVPSDFLASLSVSQTQSNSRLAEQCAFLAEQQGALLLEGHFEYTPDGFVRDGRRVRQWTLQSITGLLMSIEDMGVKILYSPSMVQTPLVLHEAFNWWHKGAKGNPQFTSRRSRPQWMWPGRASDDEITMWAFQGFGIGPVIARAAWEHAGSLRRFLEMGEEEKKAIPKIGPARAKNVDKILDRKWPDNHR